jgi:hypothetical protein
MCESNKALKIINVCFFELNSLQNLSRLVFFIVIWRFLTNLGYYQMNEGILDEIINPTFPLIFQHLVMLLHWLIDLLGYFVPLPLGRALSI